MIEHMLRPMLILDITIRYTTLGFTVVHVKRRILAVDTQKPCHHVKKNVKQACHG